LIGDDPEITRFEAARRLSPERHGAGPDRRIEPKSTNDEATCFVSSNPAFPVYAGFCRSSGGTETLFQKLSDRILRDGDHAGSLGQDVAG
jgi:hypothetical protein